MGTTGKLDALREAALLEIDELDDELLLGKDLDALAGRLASQRYLEAPRVHRALITPPAAALKGEPGEPGREHALRVRAATRVELWLLVEGFSTLSLLARDGGLDLGEARVDTDNDCLAFTYLAERPSADTANGYFQACLDDAQDRLHRVADEVEAYNASLEPALREALSAARSRAKERRRFAEQLQVPRLSAPAGQA